MAGLVWDFNAPSGQQLKKKEVYQKNRQVEDVSTVTPPAITRANAISAPSPAITTGNKRPTLDVGALVEQGIFKSAVPEVTNIAKGPQGGGLLGAFRNFGNTLKMGAMLAPAAVRSTTRKVNETLVPDRPHADYENAFTAGIGDVYSSAGGASKWLGARDEGIVLGSVGKTLQKQGENVPEGLGYDVARAVPFTLSLIPAAVGAGVGGASIAGAAGMGALGTGITGTISASLASRSLEGLLEAGGTYEEALSRGMSEEAADAAAKSVYTKNMALTGMDAGEIIVALAPLKGFGKIAQAVNRTRAGRVAVGAGRVLGTAGLEAGEEGIQEVFQRQALGDEIAFDDQMKKAMTLGGIMGGGMGAAGTGYHSLKSAFENYGQKRSQQGQLVQPAAQPVPMKLPVQPVPVMGIPRTVRSGAINLSEEPAAPPVTTTLPTTKPAAPVRQEVPTVAPIQQAPAQPGTAFTMGEKVEWTDLKGNVKPGTVFSVDGDDITIATDKGGRVPLKPDRVHKIGQQGAPASEPVSSSLQEAPKKELWEMTQADFINWSAEKTGLKPDSSGEIAALGKRSDIWKRGHKVIVKKALSESKPVPQEVLADYPDLTEQKQEVALTPQNKLQPDIVFREIRDFNGKVLGIETEKYDGTKEGARKAAETIESRLDEKYPDWSNINSRIGATDKDGNPKYTVSPNLQNIKDVHSETDEARYTWGDIGALESTSQPEATTASTAIEGEPTGTTTPATTEKPVQEGAGELAAGAPGASLSAYGLSMTKGTTKNGNTVWEVTGNTKEHKSALQKSGGRWYGPKQSWSFYGDTDPTERIMKNLPAREGSGETKPQEAVKAPSPEPAREKPPATSKGTVMAIRAQAQTMQKTIDAKRSPAIANQNPTARRANIAAGMAKEADRMELIQSKLNAVADAIEAETLPKSLNKLTKKTQVEAMERLLYLAKLNRERAQKVSYQDSKGTQVSEKDVEFAKFEGHAHPSHLKDLLQATENMKGVKDVRAVVQRVISREGKVYSFEEVDAIEALIKKAENTGKDKGIAKYIRDGLALFKRLREMGINSTDELQQALKDYLSLGVERKGPTKEQKIKELERGLLGQKLPGYFPTPRAVVERMLEEADIEPGMRVLEPSAGKGNIADMIREKEPGATLEVIEIQKTLRDVLEAKEHKVLSETDFLQYNPDEKYDRIVMNPPFEQGQDMEHVQHAYELLKPGGRLVSIMSEGPFFRSDKKVTAFREWMDELGGTSEKLPEKSFTGKDADRQTGVAARMVVIDKPGEARGESKTEPQNKLATNNITTAKTERGTEIKVQYAVVEAGNLIASHDTDMVPNESYPAELQPRQRERLASEDQVNRILANLEPEFLGESPKASDGAPIVGPDMVVESGNGRVIALQKGYGTNHKNMGKYKEWLSGNTEKFGLDKEAIEKAEKPVLVRVRQSDVDRVKFAQEANEQSVAAMSATEQAVVDAKKLAHGLLETFAPGESGEILVRSNMPFISAFMDQVVNPAEHGRYIASDGSVSQEGATRIRNAVYANAYGDISALEKLAESTDNNVKTITNGMLTAAPRMAIMKDSIESGALHPLDITGDIAAAMNKLSALREAGDTVETYLKQGSLFGEELSPIAKDLLEAFDKYKRSGKKITEVLNSYVDAVINAGDPRIKPLFDTQKPTKGEVLQAALEKVGGYEASQTSLFGDEAPGGKAVGQVHAEAGRGAEGKATGEERSVGQSPLEQVQEEMNRKIDDEIGDVNPPAGFSIKLVGKPPVAKPGQKEEGYSFDDPEIEERFQAANGMPEESLYSRVKQAWTTLINKAHREYEHLPRNAEFAELRKDLLKLAKQRGVAGDKTLRLQQGITINLDPYKFDVFRRYVILADLMEELEAGHSLPFGFTEESLQREWERINEEVNKSEEIQQAIDDRTKIWKAIISEYTSNMRAIGFNVDNRFTKESYYRHMVIQYANLKGRAVYGTGQKLKTPTGRGFLKKRGGSEMDINTNYLQAEFEIMAQMLYDAEVAQTIRAVDERDNIQKRLKQEAKAENNRAINGIIARRDELAALVEGALKKFRQKIAMSFSGLQAAAKRGELWTGEKGEYEDVVEYLKDGSQGDYYANRLFDIDEGRFKGPLSSGRLFKYLSDLLVREDVGSSQAATILKAVGQRREFIKETLGKDYKTWENMIPDGYVAWQPREGNVFFMSETIPGHLAEKLFTDQVEQLGISRDDLNRMLTLGGRRKEFVVKEEIAATLDNLTKPTADDLLHKVFSEPLRAWKVWQLLSPRRWFKYNFRNISGDAEAVFIGNPAAFRQVPRAARELYDVFADKSMTADMRDWFERGGMETLLQVQELGEINNLKMFLKLQEKKDSVAKIPLKAWQGYWKTVRLSTDYREALLRYASYLSYMEQMEKSGGQPKNFGASIPEEIMALKDNRDRAFKLSNELLGAYDEISVIGQGLRKYLMPFWSWNEVNFRRTVHLFKNAARDEKLAYAVGRKLIGTAAIRTPFLAMKVGKTLLMAAAMWTVLTIWNNWRFPEEEKELPNDVKGRPHIVFGRDKDGKILYFDRLGFVQDFLSWFGLDQVPLTAKDLINGKMTPKEFAVEAVKSPAIKLMQSLGPHVKLPFEEAFGYKTYPDFFKPGRIRDRWQYLAESFGLGNEYKQLAGKPVPTIEGSRGRGYVGSLRDIFTYSRDPGQSAYYDILDEKRRYMKKLNKPEGYSTSPRSDALYNFKLAIRYKDKEAARKYLLEYAMLGGTDKGLAQSLRTMDPLYGLNDEEKIAFVVSLNTEDRQKLVRALQYYQTVLLGK